VPTFCADKKTQKQNAPSNKTEIFESRKKKGLVHCTKGGTLEKDNARQKGKKVIVLSFCEIKK